MRSCEAGGGDDKGGSRECADRARRLSCVSDAGSRLWSARLLRAGARRAACVASLGAIGLAPAMAGAQEPCVPAPLFSGNVALNMPFQPDQPGAMLLSQATVHGDFDNDGRVDLMHGTDDGSLVYFRCRGEWWEFDPPIVIDLPFTPPPPGGGWTISALAAGDFNADGNVDLAVGDSQPAASFPPKQRIHIVRGNGDGTFQSGVPAGPVTARLVHFCTADFDADGDVDVGFGTNGDSALVDVVGVLWNAQGTGAFPTYAVIYSASVPDTGSGWIEPADVDGDGDVDAVADCPTVPAVILRNAGAGAFSPEPLNLQGVFGYTFGQLNGDSLPDLVAADPLCAGLCPQRVYVLINDGAGSYPNSVAYDVSTNGLKNASDPLVADVNGDGRAEVMMARQNLDCTATWFHDQLVIFQNSGDGTLRPPVLRHVGANKPPVRLSACDLNGDARLEIVASDEEATTLLVNVDGDVLTNYGVRMGPTGTCEAAATQFKRFTPGDINADGRFDLAAIRENPGTIVSFQEVTIMLQGVDGAFTSVHSVPLPEIVAPAFGMADFDGDGSLDLAVGTTPSVQLIRVARGHGDGTFDPWVPHNLVGSTPIHVTGGDVNGDDRPDLIAVVQFGVVHPDPGGVCVRLNDGAGGFGPPVFYQTGFMSAQTGTTSIADIDGDGDADIGVTWGPPVTVPAGVKFLLNNGDGTFVLSAGGFEHEFPSRVRFADLNADGSVDLLLTLRRLPSQPTSGGLVVALNDGSGQFQRSAHLGLFRDYGTQPASVADLNGDARLDIAIARAGVIAVYTGQGDGTFDAGIHYGGGAMTPIGGEGVIIHDFNLDGRPDLASPRGCSPSEDGYSHAGFSVLLNRMCSACYPDCNGSETLTIADFACFQTKFVQQDPYADCNDTGTFTIADFACFQTKFVQGCP